MNLTIIGTGYVGLTTGACLANLGHEVLCFDTDHSKIDLLKKGTIPFYEPALPELVQSNTDQGRLRYTTDPVESILFGEVIFNCVGTPEQHHGAADLRSVFMVADMVAEHASGYKVLVNKSTVPPGTARACQDRVRNKNHLVPIEIVSNPEFLKQGNAVHDFNHPDKIVLGSSSPKALAEMKKVYFGLVRTYLPVLETTWETAEMIKYANNSFLAAKISFINEIANICQRTGADIKIVAKALGMDYRIGPKFLNAGIGYGGSCFPKDIRALAHLAQEQGYDAALLREIDHANERQKYIFLPTILESLKTRSGNTVTIWGLSFKPKTNDVRGAPAISLITRLLSEGLTIKVYDPLAIPEARLVLGEKVIYCNSIVDSVQGSNLIVLITEWDEFRNVNFAELGKQMKSKIICDGRNIYDPQLLQEAGFEYYGIGQGKAKP